jgi:hypothetical protein
VDQPKGQTVKLKLHEPKIKIKLGVARDSPGTTPGPSTPGMDRGTPGVIVHNEALERQQQIVAAGMNGVRTNGVRNPFSSSATPVPALTAPKSRSGSAASPPRLLNGVKSEGSGAAQSPALGAANPVHPALRTANGSTYSQTPGQPSLQPSLYPSNHVSHHTTAYADGPPADLVASKVRPPNQRKYHINLLSCIMLTGQRRTFGLSSSVNTTQYSPGTHDVEALQCTHSCLVYFIASICHIRPLWC